MNRVRRYAVGCLACLAGVVLAAQRHGTAVPPGFIRCLGGLPSRSDVRACTGRTVCMTAKPSEKELVKVFGRLADKQIFLDSSAGACCHSGCDGCPYRYDFDIMRSVRPKWLPTYAERVFDSSSHKAAWRSLFDPEPAAASASDEDLFSASSDGAVPLTASTFAERLSRMPYSPPLGPMLEVTDEAPPSKDAVQWVWAKLARGSSKLSARAIEKRLSEWAQGGDSLMWSAFYEVVTADEKVEASA